MGIFGTGYGFSFLRSAVRQRAVFGAAPPGSDAHGPAAGPSRWIGRRARRHQPEAGVPAWRRGRSLAGGLPWAALAFLLGVFLCSALRADVLLSNLDESSDVGLTVGWSATLHFQFTQAIRFETGSNEGGYTLASVKAVLDNANAADGVRVRIFSASSGLPDSSVYTLENPAIGNGTNEFTAPANATLEKDKQYFVVFDSTASNQNYLVLRTLSESLTSMSAGWTLNTERHPIHKPVNYIATKITRPQKSE